VKVIVDFLRKRIQYNRIKFRRNRGKREKHFLLPMQEMEAKTQTFPF
jgi:hypothetical protein